MIVEILLGKPKKKQLARQVSFELNFHPMKSRHFPIFIHYYIDNHAFTLELNKVSFDLSAAQD